MRQDNSIHIVYTLIAYTSVYHMLNIIMNGVSMVRSNFRFQIFFAIERILISQYCHKQTEKITAQKFSFLNTSCKQQLWIGVFILNSLIDLFHLFLDHPHRMCNMKQITLSRLSQLHITFFNRICSINCGYF